MSQKSVIIAIISLLALSFISLGFIENRAKDPNLNKDWWALSFQNPHGNSLDFTIENHSNSNNFTYEVTQDATTLTKEAIIIPKGTTKNISISQRTSDTKTMISAWTNDEDKKEIYK
ncbi:MAG: hypothetical protein PHT88_00770 [Candidatus Moranbacteria bacterium]|nr:hypothetical protein [Candidatus Moranbacteria bacterium]